MIKKIPILSSDFKVIYQDGKKWIEYNRYIALEEAENKATELREKGLKTRVIKNMIKQ